VLVTVINSWVKAFKAPSTLNRCRPDGALINKRVNDHKKPKKGARTKWAASTKKGGVHPHGLANRRVGETPPQSQNSVRYFPAFCPPFHLHHVHGGQNVALGFALISNALQRHFAHPTGLMIIDDTDESRIVF